MSYHHSTTAISVVLLFSLYETRNYSVDFNVPKSPGSRFWVVENEGVIYCPCDAKLASDFEGVGRLLTQFIDFLDGLRQKHLPS
jgi:hypothetical protein